MRLPLPGRLNRYVARAGRAVQSERIAYSRSKPIQHDVVLYESFAGNGVLCNPEAIFRYLLNRPEFDHLWHVWSIADEAAIARFEAEFGAHPRVSFVHRAASSTGGCCPRPATWSTTRPSRRRSASAPARCI
ncbi:CDP-glycerol glycerophosphotransferase family protein [Microbacterium elymi]|uniref:CDP-glycerol glycerophosphotransferase family protein n=1 Tax=Microbacterium elymi TaxID=2909587 RepID=A0ABY5NGZ5_9MICO|nr:CDP-glycerol glycerophosphotransferase family protein [Microbacterium elymi]UUT34411.1 CDP-glycerol glycerophosphotransferase family protein [Microbacterium elymi]